MIRIMPRYLCRYDVELSIPNNQPAILDFWGRRGRTPQIWSMPNKGVPINRNHRAFIFIYLYPDENKVPEMATPKKATGKKLKKSSDNTKAPKKRASKRPNSSSTSYMCQIDTQHNV
jgi:hypothetical protein